MPSSREGELDHSGLRMVRVQVDHDDHDVGEVGIRLPVGEERVIVDGEKTQPAIVPERGILATDAVDERHQRMQPFRCVRSQCRTWYFSESRYSSVPGHRGAHGLFEGRTVYPVAARERRGGKLPLGAADVRASTEDFGRQIRRQLGRCYENRRRGCELLGKSAGLLTEQHAKPVHRLLVGSLERWDLRFRSRCLAAPSTFAQFVLRTSSVFASSRTA